MDFEILDQLSKMAFELMESSDDQIKRIGRSLFLLLGACALGPKVLKDFVDNCSNFFDERGLERPKISC